MCATSEFHHSNLAVGKACSRRIGTLHRATCFSRSQGRYLQRHVAMHIPIAGSQATRLIFARHIRRFRVDESRHVSHADCLSNKQTPWKGCKAKGKSLLCHHVLAKFFQGNQKCNEMDQMSLQAMNCRRDWCLLAGSSVHGLHGSKDQSLMTVMLAAYDLLDHQQRAAAHFAVSLPCQLLLHCGGQLAGQKQVRWFWQLTLPV